MVPVTTPPTAVLAIDRHRRSVRLDGSAVPLGGRAFDVLMALTARPGRVCGVDELHHAVWPDVPVEPNNVRVQIAALRQRLGAAHIENVARRGYRWMGPVQDAGAAPGPVLIGRDDELEALGSLAAQHRLVSVLGAGGIGKTRLVRAWRRGLLSTGEVAAEATGSGTAWVDLTPLEQPAGVLAAVAQAFAQATTLALPEPAGLPALSAALAGAAGGSLPTLVLDNAEHLIDEVGRIAQALLDAVPALRIVVTSQLPLRLPGEQLLRLGPLELPERGVTLGQARALGALVLFAERVHALDPRFELTAGNLATVADICCRLDGLPLAIELAAARVPAMGLQALQRALGERLGVLTGGPGHAPARLRTLRAALAWSYALLDATAQRVFCQLGTFAGPFSLDDAQRALVAPDRTDLSEWAVADALNRLVDASLLGHDGGDPPRYRLLELPRAFALETLGLPARSPPPNAGTGVAPASPLLQRLVQQIGVTDTGRLDAQAVLALAQRLRPDDLRQFDTALQELKRAVDLAGSVVADTGDELDAGIDQVLATVAEQTRLGHFDRGADELDAALAELGRREERRQLALRRSRQTLLDAGVRQDLLRRDAPAVARRLFELAALDAGAGRPSWSPQYIEREAEFVAEGLLPGRLLKLAVGVELARRRMADAGDAAERLAVQRVLVGALKEKGRRETTHASLEEAMRLCREALAAGPGGSLSALDRAVLLTDLAGVLNVLGYRKGDRAMLEEAETCSLQALGEPALAGVPAARLECLLERARALRQRGLRDMSNDRLRASVDVCREAIAPAGRAEVPQLLMQLHNELGMALVELSGREVSIERARQAVDALDSALRGIERDDDFVIWATLQATLGQALRQLGDPETEPDPERAVVALRKSDAAFEEALALTSPEGEPVTYGMRCYNQASMLRLLGKHEPGTRLLERVVGRNREALACFPREQFPMYWATVKDGLGASLYTLAERQTGTAALATLGEAEQVMLAAIEYRNREASPREWTVTQGNIAHVRKAMGERTGEPHFVLDAIDRWEQTLPLLAADGADAEHQEVRGYVKAARAWLATRAAA